jgi:hypothetical protein
MNKVDAIIKENPGVSLDDLVNSRKINADQKAQALKKPQLLFHLNMLEEQLTLLRRIEVDHEKATAREKEKWLAAQEADITKALANAQREVAKGRKVDLLVFSRFLAAAATRRTQGDNDSDEARAFEGALLLVYGGDVKAVDGMQKIIDGSEEKVVDVQGEVTNTTCTSSVLCSLRAIIS